MKFFWRNENAAGGGDRRAQRLDMGLLQYGIQFAQRLELPEASEAMELRLLGDGAEGPRERRGFSVKAPCYLLVYGREGASPLNAGYVLGQLAVFLSLGGIEGKITAQVPERYQTGEDGRVCFGALAVGVAPGYWSRGRAKLPERPLICRETEEDWTGKVLDYAKTLLPQEMQTGVRIIHRDTVLHLAAGKYFGRSAETCLFHAGVTLAGVMAAGEELWIDLGMVHLTPELWSQETGPDYVITVCRKADQKEISEGRTVRERAPGKLRSGQRWKYA